MRATVDRIWAQLRDYFAKMPRKNKIQLAVLSAVVITLAIVTASILGQTTYVVLLAAETPADAGEVLTRLEELGVPYQVEGNRVLVPEERFGALRITLASEGLLGAAGFDRGTMEEAAGFAVSDAHSRRLYDVQLGEDIATQILRSPRIQQALVLVTSGETSPFRFSTNTRRPTASVMLVLRGGGMLTDAEAQGIGELVRAGVPGIGYSDIAITDETFRHYPLREPGEDLDVELGTRIMLQNQLAEQIRSQVIHMLTPAFSVANLSVQANVKLNYDRVVTESVEYDPPVPGEMDGIVRSYEEILRNSRSRDIAEGIPGTDPNGMGTAEYPYGTLEDGYEFAESIIARNYDINETRMRIEHEVGYIESVTVGVIINSETEGMEGDYTEELKEVIAKVIGFGAANVEIQMMPFNYQDTSMADMYERWAELEASRRSRELFETILMYSVILLLGIMSMMLIRTIVRTVKPPPEPEPVLAAVGLGGIDLIVEDAEDHVDEIEYEDVDLTQKSAGLEQIERFIDKDSAAVAQLLRNWLSDE
jgi:flagellar M-ring protein FliF